MNEKIRRFIPLFYLLLAFLAGCLVTGFFVIGQRSAASRRLDKRYADQHRGATEIIGRLEDELGRERELNRQLREHNNRARELTEGLTKSADRNVRNLSDAIGLIGEIRAEIKVLEDFYTGSDTGNGGR